MSPDPPAVVAVDLGGTKTTVGLVEGPAVSHVRTAPTPAHDGPAAVLRAVVDLVAEVRADSSCAPAVLGVGSAGVLDPHTGDVVAATDAITGWAGTRLAATLAEATGLPARALNDVHAHALGEARHGAGAGLGTVLVVAVGTGVGGALVLDGEVQRGATGRGGHLGHVPAPEAAGLRCPCGAVGHLEAVASGPGLLALHERRTGRRLPHARAVVEAAGAGDAEASRSVALAARALGRALGGWVNASDPDVVVLTGGLASAGPAWWDRVVAGAAEETVGAVRRCPVVPAARGAEAALLGAAAFALDRAGTALVEVGA